MKVPVKFRRTRNFWRGYTEARNGQKLDADGLRFCLSQEDHEAGRLWFTQMRAAGVETPEWMWSEDVPSVIRYFKTDRGI